MVDTKESNQVYIVLFKDNYNFKNTNLMKNLLK